MILRVVKMNVDEEKRDAFELFMKNLREEKLKLAGCLHFDYFHEKNNKNIFYSYTIWESEKYLKQYKKTDLFIEVVSTLKKLCTEEPKAWTIENVFKEVNHEEE